MDMAANRATERNNTWRSDMKKIQLKECNQFVVPWKIRFHVLRHTDEDGGWALQIGLGVVRIIIQRRFKLYTRDGRFVPHSGAFVSLIPFRCTNGQIVPTLRMAWESKILFVKQ